MKMTLAEWCLMTCECPEPKLAEGINDVCEDCGYYLPQSNEVAG